MSAASSYDAGVTVTVAVAVLLPLSESVYVAVTVRVVAFSSAATVSSPFEESLNSVPLVALLEPATDHVTVLLLSVVPSTFTSAVKFTVFSLPPETSAVAEAGVISTVMVLAGVGTSAAIVTDTIYSSKSIDIPSHIHYDEHIRNFPVQHFAHMTFSVRFS
jgi:hypothetical protein